MRNFVSDTLSQREMADLVRSVFNNPVELDLVIEEQAHDFTANPDSAPERARKSAFVVFWYIIKLTQGLGLFRRHPSDVLNDLYPEVHTTLFSEQRVAEEKVSSASVQADGRRNRL